MGSTDSLETLATSQDFESISSGFSGCGLTGSSPSPEVGFNIELFSKAKGSSPSSELGLNKNNSSSQVAVSDEILRERESNKQAWPKDRKVNMVPEKNAKIDAPKSRFKRKIGCVSSSQPICGTEIDL